jgi:hypothetical protein
MTYIGLSITKSTTFRGASQEFSNVYYYFSAGTAPSVADADAIIDHVKALEVPFHSSQVTFVRGRLWLNTGLKATSEMISQKNLTGTGSTTTVGEFDKERAYLFRWRAGSDSRGQPVYLRKWYHSCGNGPGNATPTTGSLAQTTSLGSTIKTSMASAVNNVLDITVVGQSWRLVAKSNRGVGIGEAAQSHNWLEHRQLGDMWRAQ